MAKTRSSRQSLKTYRAKRDFKKSPEPAGREKGKAAKQGKKLIFCVQKHLASHLHYDFRLEYGGVMLSWAVPKGPSLDPADKRLAMRVEDHPRGYADFEGVIPEGYGAGIVMLWDKGTWTAETDDIDAALKKGDLKFKLDGVKLKGSWVLVRTRDRKSGAAESRTWLLIKHRDDWAGRVDVTEAAPNSIKSFGDFADILGADQPAIWKSHMPSEHGQANEMLRAVIARAATRKARAKPTRKAATSRASARKKAPSRPK